MSTIILKQLCFVRRLNRHMTDSMQNSTDVDRPTLYVNGWTPLTEPIFARITFKYLLAQTDNLKSDRYDETRVLTIHTRRISKFPSSLPLKKFVFYWTVYATNMSITNAFPPEFRETPVQHKSFKYSMTYGKVAPCFASHSANLIQLHAWFNAWGIPFALYVERRTTMLDQAVHIVWVPYVDLRVPPTSLKTLHWRHMGVMVSQIPTIWLFVFSS